MTLSGKDKTIIGLSAVGAAGLLGYGIYYGLSGQSIVSACENEQQTLFNKYISTLSTYLQQDSAEGIAITQEQQSNLNYLLTQMNNQQASCIAAQKKLSQPITSILSTSATIISAAIATAIIIYGLSKAYKVIKGKKPPSTGGGKTWPEAAAFITHIVVQDLYDNGKISTEEAEAMSQYAPSSNYAGVLQDDVSIQINNVFVQQQIMTEAEAVAYISVASEAIVDDMEIVALVAV